MTETDQEESAGLSPVPLMEISTGFWASKTLAAAHELDLFSYLSCEGPAGLERLATRFGLHARPTEILLTACVSLGLLEKSGEVYANSPLAEKYLVRGKPEYFGGWIEMADRREYPAWGRVMDALRNNQPTTWDPAQQQGIFDGEDPVMLSVFWEAMHSLSTGTAKVLGRTLDLSGVRRLLDVGGGSGAFGIELCGRYPELRADVFELPFVCDLAEKKIAQAGMGSRVGTVPGNFQTDTSLPTEYDAVLLSLVLHDWDEDDGRALIRKCFSALPPGGLLIISELLVNDDKTGPADAALMSMNMLIENWGRNYTAAEYAQWLSEAGFTEVRTVRFTAPGANGAITAHKP
ncbi:methyltransferase [Streptomyces sp. C3-3]|uniref:methyltransferase n=1 Tax=Streptomyces sp. C3-3 TaxID=2824901 RepID=UPI001B37A682|nr:methyltransferase [Streptomyces sp. C3-3]MBQ1116467.1 methyltransferase domain-containing protein [Streptomyces sp. C3-3]